jgi:preprotein translocase subunit SecF
MFKISILVWMVLGTALAGTAVIAVLAVPGLADQAMKNIPFAVLIGFAAAAPLSYLIARKIDASPVR